MTLLSWLPRGRRTTCLAPPPDPGNDRRVTPRYRCRLRCTCRPVSLSPRLAGWKGQIQDISAEGVLLLLANPVPPGTFLIIEPESNGRGPRPPLRGRVVRSSRDGPTGPWSIGCTFHPRLPDSQLNSLI